MTGPLVAALLALLVATAAAVVVLADPLATVVVFGLYSFGLAMLWAVFRAPDVALTEAAVGAGVTTSLLLVVVVRTRATSGSAPAETDATDESAPTGTGATDESAPTGTGAADESVPAETDAPTFRSLSDVRARSVAAVAGLVAALLWTVPALPAVGDPAAPAFGRVAPAYLRRAPELGVRNVVTAVLVAFRGFDTFGEVVVVFAAGVAVLVVFDREVVP